MCNNSCNLTFFIFPTFVRSCFSRGRVSIKSDLDPGHSKKGKKHLAMGKRESIYMYCMHGQPGTAQYIKMHWTGHNYEGLGQEK